MPRDYYDILGVDRKADAAAIKKAYRRLAKKTHPDVNKEPDAAKQFAELQEAYDVLSNAQKRSKYDRFGHAGVNAEEPFARAGRTTYTTPGGHSFNAEGMGSGFSMDDVFEQFFGRGRGAPGGFAGAGPGQSARHAPPNDRGDDVRQTITVPFDQAVRGGTVRLRVTGGAGSEDIDVKIPRGVGDGAQLRLRGKGRPSFLGGKPGDLLLTVKVAAHPYFRRQGLDLHVDVPVTLDEAVFGATIEVPTLSGRANLKVPPGTGGQSKLRLRGAGIENAKGDRGDLYAVIRVDVPKDLTDEQRSALEALRGKLPDPRKGLKW